ncbi:hypothetical protein PI125_g4711 [Phytophthora idaei]|nr:hypothetical protein PI125_g4711 [Phytophthora idaei]KAG3169878.1 hypothetical protein PI126_g2588 [Phytophthora idaei]
MMKLTDLQWVGQPVFKLAMDCHGHETQIRGKVVKYCPSSARYLLMYADGSSDGVPVDEIEDHVPMLLQLPVKRRRSISKCQRAAAQSEEPAECHEPAVQPPKRLKVSADMQAVVSRFIQTTLCELTTVLDISEEKRQTLLATLDGCMDQPLAALAQYGQNGGLDALYQTIRLCASCGENVHDVAAAKKISVEKESLRTPESSSEFTPRHAAETPPSSPCSRSPCGQHLRELLQGNGGGVFSPKPTRLKEQHAPHKREQKARKPRSLRPKKTPTCRRIEEDSLPEKVPVVVDLTGDGSEEEDDEEIDDTPSARRRLHFGLNSTVLFDMRDSVDVFSWQLTRTGHDRRKLPKQNSEAWKSVLKTSTRQESYEWGID